MDGLRTKYDMAPGLQPCKSSKYQSFQEAPRNFTHYSILLLLSLYLINTSLGILWINELLHSADMIAIVGR